MAGDPPGRKKKERRPAVGLLLLLLLLDLRKKQTSRGMNVLGGLLGMTEEVGREEELAMLMLELRAWRYSGGMLAMGRDERRRWVEEEEEETDEARRLV